MKTWFPKPGEVEQKWWLVDASDKTLGRLATQLANIIRGKNKVYFSKGTDTGDFVVVVNAEKIKMTGKKWEDKNYFRHSRYFGSLKSLTALELRQKFPTQLIEKAVKDMLPKTRLSDKVITKLKVYKGPEHPHTVQKPESLTLK